jgi:long-chain fatty acid transport protein
MARLGDDSGAGFGWDDITIFKFGTQWKQNELWTWRAGVSYGEQPISDSEVLFNILAPGVQKWHLTTGFSRTLGKDDELSFAFMYSPSYTVSGTNPLSPTQTIDLEMHQYSFQLAWSKQF